MTRTYLSILDLPPVKPSAIALGIVFNQVSSAAVLAPLFGDTYHRAKAADSKEEFLKSKEAATAAASWGSSIVGSGIQTYGVAALINATGTLSYKGAAYLGSLIFFASYSPSVCEALQCAQYSLAPFDQVTNSLFLSSSYLPSSLRTDRLTPSPSVFCHASSRQSVSACSSPTGVPAPTLLTRA